MREAPGRVEEPGWVERQAALLEVARRQLFFVGGAPRSGTTWLQHMLDAHPEVSCRGEGLFQREMATPLDRMVAGRRRAIEGKNGTIFKGQAGYPLPEAEDAELMLGTGVLAALARQAAGGGFKAIGEKTPENVFLFPRLRRLFPGARFLGIARDPRDVLASSWHMFGRVGAGHGAAGEDEAGHDGAGHDGAGAKAAMVRASLPSLDRGLRAMVALAGDRGACAVVTYESLHRDPAAPLGAMFRLLGVADDAATVRGCVAAASFAAMAGRVPSGAGMHLRRGVVGEWRDTLPEELGEEVVAALGWSFGVFGWRR